jgi:hypothetical protein
MKTLRHALVAGVALSSLTAHAVKLSDYPGFEYDVRFTNPVCGPYAYDKPVQSVSGKTLTQKPKDVYCTQKDAAASGARAEAPLSKLLSWINDASTKEIFFMYLSFSSTPVTEALCKAVKERGVKVTFVLDQGTDTTKADQLVACNPQLVSKNLRGHQGGIGYAHNKLFVVNPNSKGTIRLAFSSGNMTSGTVLHHENWHFITTDVKSYFAQAHLCAVNGVMDSMGSSSIAEYRKYISACRAKIKAPAEDDIRVFFSPAAGAAATKYMTAAIAKSNQILIGAHRFSYNEMIKALGDRIAKSPKLDLRIVADDDTYWVGTTGNQVGDNLPMEYNNIMRLVKQGAQVKWMETNHQAHLLYHSKFLVFDDKAVFAGAGNLTGTGFKENFENYYFITIPSVVQAFRKQYQHVWTNLATAPADMPKVDTVPAGI